MKRFIEFVVCGRKYLLSVEAVRQDMAKWHDLEVDEILEDDDILDWIENNMDWIDVKDHVIEVPYVVQECDKDAEFLKSKKSIVWKDV